MRPRRPTNTKRIERLERAVFGPPAPPPAPPATPPRMYGDLQCSFCGKAQREIRKLIAGPTVYICNECVELCVSIVVDVDDAAELEATITGLCKSIDTGVAGRDERKRAAEVAP